jgi:predicted enzyme related to lactoylglutathione lyase
MRETMVAVIAAVTLTAGLLQSPPQKPPPRDAGPGGIAWFDLTTSDLAKSRAFYARLFDWEFAPVKGTDLALEIVARGVSIGTLRVAEGKFTAFGGVVYVQVPDIQAACAKVKELGGSVGPGFPFNLIERPGAIAVVLDPAGHPVGMYSRTPIAPAKP